MSIYKYIDHTLLKPTATEADIVQLCNEAKQYNFFAVCVNSCFVRLASDNLENSNVKVCSVIGFPLGAMSTKAKVYEAKNAIDNGADELDMVINIGYLKSKNFDAVWKDIEAVKNIIPNRTLKVIIETCHLNNIEIIKASELAVQSGADFIKTSTGFGSGGATVHDVKLIKSVVEHCNTKIKASGGIRDYETAKKFIDLGVDRLGVSAGIAISKGEPSNSDY